MNFMDKLKGEQDIIALCESFADDYNSSLKNKPSNIEEGKEGEDAGKSGDDVFNPDDLFNTVDLPEDEPAQQGPSFSADDIELSHEQKEEIKKTLAAALDEIQDKDSMSDPALEMIVNEVANQTSYLSEAEEAELDGPVEKQQYRVGLIEAIKKFINELLGVAVDNEGTLPDDLDNLGAEGAPEGGEGAEGAAPGPEGAEGGEGAPEGAPETEDKEKVTEGTEPPAAGVTPEDDPNSDTNKDDPNANNNAPIQESADGTDATADGTDASAVDPESAVQEGACNECGEGGAVEVDPSEIVQIVDDDDPRVSPIIEPVGGESVPGLGEPDGDESGVVVPGSEEGGLSDDTPLTVGVLKELVGQLLTESVDGGEKSLADLWKSLSGNAVTLAKPATKGVQKTSDPKGKPPEGTKYEEVKKEEGNESSLPKPATKGQQKTLSPEGKAPEGTEYAKPAAPKGGSAPTAKKPEVTKEEAANLVAATLNEGNSKKSTLSFLKEAAESIKQAKKQLNS